MPIRNKLSLLISILLLLEANPSMANKSPSVMGEHFPPHSTIVAPKTHTNPTLQKPKQDVSSEKFPQPYEIGSAKWFASIGALAVMELFLTILSFAPGGLLSQ